MLMNMGERRVYFQPGQWFHCFNRGVDKRRIFMSQTDYRRFLALLYACNDAEPIHVSNYEQGLRSKTLNSVLRIERKTPLVDIGAYNLMPNHYHLLLRENVDGGITSFMRKIGTAYTMYFNIRYKRSGALYQGAFKAKHVSTDGYFQRVLNYVHGNHAELSEPRWKKGVVRNDRVLTESLLAYPYSSLRDYCGAPRPEGAILNLGSILEVVEKIPAVERILEDARTFARQNDDE